MLPLVSLLRISSQRFVWFAMFCRQTEAVKRKVRNLRQNTCQLESRNTQTLKNANYNIARALVLCKSYWAVMNKIFMYARPCSIKWRVQFHFSCKISVEFSARSLCLSFGNVKIILSNSNPTLSLWLLPGKDVYLQREYFDFVCLHFPGVILLCLATLFLWAQELKERRFKFF